MVLRPFWARPWQSGIGERCRCGGGIDAIARYRRGSVNWAGNAAPGVGVRGQHWALVGLRCGAQPMKRRS